MTIAWAADPAASLLEPFEPDGATWVGRFVWPGVGPVYERARPTACSRFVLAERVEGSLAPHPALDGVEYTGTGALVARIDRAGLERCCAEQPDQCTDRLVDAVVEGRGSAGATRFDDPVYFALQTEALDLAPMGCGAWVEQTPAADRGRYFVGASTRPAETEKRARTRAMHAAMLRAANTRSHEAPFQLALELEPQAWCVEPVADGYLAQVLAWLPDGY